MSLSKHKSEDFKAELQAKNENKIKIESRITLVEWFAENSASQCESRPYDRVKSSVFRRCRKTASDDDDVTSGGRSFQARARATGNARSPIVECAVAWTTSAAVDADVPRQEFVHFASLRVSKTRSGPAALAVLVAGMSHGAEN